MNTETMQTQSAKGSFPESDVDSVLFCPSCDGPFYYHKKIEIRGTRPAELVARETGEPLPLDLSAGQQDAVVEIVAQRRIFAATSAMRTLIHTDKEYEPVGRSKPFHCPSCGATIRLLIQTVVIGAESADEPPFQPDAPDAPSTSTLAPEDQKLWNEWTENGFIENFFTAGVIDNPSIGFVREKTAAAQLSYIKSWFRSAVARELPRARLSQAVAEYGTKDIDCFSAQGVVAILAEGYIRCLMPKSAVFGYRPKESLTVACANGKTALQKAPPMEYWIKTKYGYSLGRGVFFDALQQESIGAFGRATGSQRQTRSGLPVVGDDHEG